MTSFYVDAFGDDGNDGTSPVAPWKTIAKVNGSRFQPGDSILFKRAGVWRETLIVPSAGASGNPITFGAYGGGADPVISGADVATGFVSVPGDVAVDQQTGDDFAYLNIGNAPTQMSWAQSYTPRKTFSVSAVGLKMWKAGNLLDNVYVEIRADNSGVPGAVVANGRSESVSGADLVSTSSGAVVNFAFPISPSLSASEQYHITIWRDGGLDVVNFPRLKAQSDPNVGNPALRLNNATSTWGFPFAGKLYFVIFESGSARAWTKPVATDPRVVLFNGSYGVRRSPSYGVLSEYDWHWQSGMLTIYSDGNPETVYTSSCVEIGTRSVCFDANGKSYVDAEDITMHAARQYCLFNEGTHSHTCFRRLTFYAAGGYGQITQAETTQTDILFEDCSSSYCGGFGFLAGNKTARFIYRRCSSNNDAPYHEEFDDGTYETYWGGGIKLVNGESLNIAAGSGLSDSHIIENCTITNAGRLVDGRTSVNKGYGIWLDGVWPSTGDAAEGSIVRHNVCRDNKAAGLFCEKTRHSLWYGNLSYRNSSHGFRLDGDAGPPDVGQIPVRDNMVANNVLYGNGGDGIYAAGGYNFPNYYVFNNTFHNNISIANKGAQLLTKWGADNTGAGNKGNVYEYNCLGAESDGFVSWGGAKKNTFVAWEAVYGGSSSSVQADPLFMDAANADFSLQASSPCRGAGVAHSNVIVALGHRPFGTKPDVGAYSIIPDTTLDFSKFFLGTIHEGVADIRVWSNTKSMDELLDLTK